MRISNVGLFVKDLEGARKFFEDFFGAQVHATYEEDDGYKSYIMKFDENPKLELMSKPTVVDEKKDPSFLTVSPQRRYDGPEPYRLCAHLHQGRLPREARRDHREVQGCQLHHPL